MPPKLRLPLIDLLNERLAALMHQKGYSEEFMHERLQGRGRGIGFHEEKASLVTWSNDGSHVRVHDLAAVYYAAMQLVAQKIANELLPLMEEDARREMQHQIWKSLHQLQQLENLAMLNKFEMDMRTLLESQRTDLGA